VLIVLLDDVGFGASSAFGGPVSMPTAERLAANGLRYNRFPQGGRPACVAVNCKATSC
jgi:arylsulfatase A-like enzyme